VSVLLFDLDNTLYPFSLGVVARIDRRINEYLHRRVGIALDQVDELRRRFWAEHGTTLRGLMIGHGVDADDYLDFVHDIVLDDLLRPDPDLGRLLERLPGRKIVFTNASRAHARRVLAALGLATSFEAIHSLEDLGYVPKPAPEAFQIVLDRSGANASDCSLIDDLRPNLAAAKRLGMRTVWVDESATARERDDPQNDIGEIDHIVERVHAIETIFGVTSAPRV
jgi:putative hydrolase of the HAD superfamily